MPASDSVPASGRLDQVDALVLAGGGIERERFRGLAPAIVQKAQIQLLGTPMVEWVVGGLRASPRVGRVVVVGHPALKTPGLQRAGARIIPEAGDIAGNVRAGLEALRAAERVLVVSADLPLLGGAALEDLLYGATDADLVFPIVERADALRDFPGRAWVFVTTPDGAFTGGSAALLRPRILLERWEWAGRLLDARRSVLRLAALFGPWFACRLAARRLTLADAERRISRLLRVSGRAYRSRYAEVAMDVDKMSDIALAEAVLGRRG